MQLAQVTRSAGKQRPHTSASIFIQNPAHGVATEVENLVVYIAAEKTT